MKLFLSEKETDISVTNKWGSLVILIKQEGNNFDILSIDCRPSVILSLFVWL
jgi:hypothetical protein